MHLHQEHAPPRVYPTKPQIVDHKILGVRMLYDEPHPYLEQAYGVACTLEEALDSDVEWNMKLLAASARALCSLIHLAAIGLESMDRQREAAAQEHRS